MKVVIENHNPEWKTQFLEIKEHFERALGNIPIISIEHVGSTSIPSLKAKPVLDIDIIIPFSSLQATRGALGGVGYTDCGEMNVPGRFAFRQPGYGRYDAAHGLDRSGRPRYNTYLMIDGCTALKNHLDVKRVLLEDMQIREEYGRVKEQLEEMEFDNIGQYVVGKSDILIKVLRKAGWSQESLDSVIKVNK